MPKSLESSFIQKLFSIILLPAILAGAFSAAAPAQTRRKVSSPKPSTNPSGQGGDNQYVCKGGWSGVIKFSKTLKDNPAPQKKKGVTAVTTTHFLDRDYKYNGSLFIDGYDPRATKTKGQATLVDSDKKRRRVEGREDCRYDNAPPIDVYKEISDNELTNAFGEGDGQFFLSVNEYTGTYSFNFRLPESKGTTETESKTEARQCIKTDYPVQNKKFPVIVPGFGASVDEQKIDPKNPDVLAGTKTWDTSTGSVKSFSYTVTWSFKRCPAPLELEAVEFDENPLPDWEKWVDAEGAAVDGNRVRIRARVTNYSSETKFPKLTFRELRAGLELPDSARSISIAPGESREIEYIWDTSGWAWETGAKPASERRVKVEMTEPSVPQKEKTAGFTVIPRPVILVHGLWANASAWTGYGDYLNQTHGALWRAFAVGHNPSVALMKTGEKGKPTPSNSIAQNAFELDKEIRDVTKDYNAWHVDIVAHSMGGLISRYYIQNLMQRVPDGKPQVTRLVMLGTPNMGSPCATIMDFTFFMYRQQTRAVSDLTPVNVEKFNKENLNRRGTRFSALVGDAVPVTCQLPVVGDGVVDILSARWKIADFRYVRDVHTSLTDRPYFMSFVLPRLAVSHHGNHQPDRNNYGLNFDNDLQRSPFVNASFNRTDDLEKPQMPENLKIDASKLLTLQAKQATEIEIAVAANANSGITFAAPETISATLTDEKGAVVGKNLAGSAESKADFRGIPIQARAAGVWKLKLENTGAGEASAVVAAWTDTSGTRAAFTIEAGKPNAAGQIPLTAKLRENDSPMAGATVKAQILDESGNVTEITLVDDGQSGDGAAGDGVYGALAAKPASGEHSVTAKAEIAGQMLVAATSFTIGAAQKETQVKTALKKSKK